ncbi:MAG: globin domain-containing protein [Aquabacterium sp.]
MTPQQIELVRNSWPPLEARRDELAAAFYGRLFEIAPETRAMFSADMAAQGTKLMASLNVVVEHLSDLAPLKPVLGQLGVRHLQWHVTAAHYDQVGAALMWALRQALGPAFDDALDTAWQRAYDRVARVMKDAAYGAG